MHNTSDMVSVLFFSFFFVILQCNIAMQPELFLCTEGAVLKFENASVSRNPLNIVLLGSNVWIYSIKIALTILSGNINTFNGPVT